MEFIEKYARVDDSDIDIDDANILEEEVSDLDFIDYVTEYEDLQSSD